MAPLTMMLYIWLGASAAGVATVVFVVALELRTTIADFSTDGAAPACGAAPGRADAARSGMVFPTGAGV